MGNIISNHYVEYAFNLGQILIFGFMMGVCFWLYSLFSSDEINIRGIVKNQSIDNSS